MLRIYSTDGYNVRPSLLPALEDYLINHFRSLTTGLSIEIALNYGSKIQSPELCEIVEKYIGMNASAIDKPTLVRLFEAFNGAKYVRPKMIQLLLEQITEGIGSLSTSEQVNYLSLIQNLEDRFTL